MTRDTPASERRRSLVKGGLAWRGLAGISGLAGLGGLAAMSALGSGPALAAPGPPSAGSSQAGPAGLLAERLFGSPARLRLGAGGTGAVAGAATGPNAFTLAERAAATAAVLALWQQLDHEWNAWKDGELGRLNRWLRRPGRTAEAWSPAVSAGLAALIRQAAAAEAASQGCFHAGLGEVVAAWGFHADQPGSGPAPGMRQGRGAGFEVRACSLTQLRWQADGGRLQAPAAVTGMGPRPAAGLDEGLASASRRTHGQASPADSALSIDLGGIGKGAAADLALALLADRGGHAALVDLGGHVVVRGQAGPGTPWRVGIRQACSAEEAARVGPSPRLLAWLEAGSATGPGAEAIISSGQYERWRRTGRGGTEPAVLGHVMDPRTRAPVSGLIGTTVVHADAAWADAAATALLVAGPGGWPAVARGMGLDQVLVQHADGSVEASPALARRLHLVPGSPRRIQVRDPGTA